MAYKLEEPLIGHKGSILTSATLPGNSTVNPIWQGYNTNERWANHWWLSSNITVVRQSYFHAGSKKIWRYYFVYIYPGLTL